MPETIEQPRRRRILRSFKLTEISSVDRPAQEGALMTMMKRRDEKKEDNMFTKLIKDEPAPADFDAAVAAIRKRDNCSGTAALSTARGEYPALFKRWQEDGAAMGTAHAETLQKGAETSDAVATFDKRISEIMKRDGVSRMTAQQRAHDELPAEYQAYQSA